MDSFKVGLGTLFGVLGGTAGALAATVFLMKSEPVIIPDFHLSSSTLDGALDGPSPGDPRGNGTGPERPGGDGQAGGDSWQQIGRQGWEPQAPSGPAAPPPGLPLTVGWHQPSSVGGVTLFSAPSRGGGSGRAGGGFGGAGGGFGGSGGGGSGSGGQTDDEDETGPTDDAGEQGEQPVEQPVETIVQLVAPLFEPGPNPPPGMPDFVLTTGPADFGDDGGGNGGQGPGSDYSPTDGGSEGEGPGTDRSAPANSGGDGGAGATNISEPAGWALVLPGLAALALRRMRRRSG